MLECKVLTREVYAALEGVLGAENITQEPAILDSYAWQPAVNLAKEAWIHRPAAAVLP